MQPSLPVELLAHVFDFVAAIDPLALLLLRGTCKQWKVTIEESPERWRRVCAEHHLLFGLDGGSKGVRAPPAICGSAAEGGVDDSNPRAGWMRWFVSQARLVERWEEHPADHGSCDTSSIAGTC